MCLSDRPKVNIMSSTYTPGRQTPAVQESNEQVIAARDAERLRRRAASSNTNLTGGNLSNTSTETKTMLGQ